MSGRLSRVLALAGLVALGAAVQATFTVTPTSHDFGDVALGASVAQPFKVVLPPGTPAGSTLSVAITGLYSMEFRVDPDTLTVNSGVDCSGPLVCTVTVSLFPQTLGPKTGALVITDAHGARVSVPLKGNGVQPLCTNQVVFCNYAHLYSGIFGWTIALSSSIGQDSTWAQVYVTNGSALCMGGAKSVDHGQSRRGVIMGKGLFAVEWLEDPMYPWVYQITAACPSPEWPPGPNGEAGTPSEPAELGHNDQSTLKQPDPRIRAGWTLQQTVARITTLQGGLRLPAPETDPLNGVSGVVTIVWNLCPKVDSLFRCP
jgi:hypothetical protein